MAMIKSKEEITLIREGGKILSDVLRRVIKEARAGVTTAELDALAEKFILEAGGEPSFKGYGEPGNEFPGTLCTSINSAVVHGIPNEVILKDGDIVGLDIGMRYPKRTGLYTDMAVTVAIGKIDKETKKLMKVTKQALELWIKKIKPGRTINEIAKQVQAYIEKNNFSVVRDLVGHGVGHEVHEEPQVPNFYAPNMDTELIEGMVLALEPMVNLGTYQVKTANDGWTVVTRDGKNSAHYEHTVAVTKNGCEVLTR